MFKLEKIRSILPFLMAFIMLGGTPTMARINSLAFKNITKHFKENQQFYSPTLGMVALESGLIYNLRFYGNYIAGWDKNNPGLHRHIDDKSDNDPLWKLVRQLFPSPTGTLAAETSSDTNFGKHVLSPKVVAILLNYAHQIRQDRKSIGASNTSSIQGMEEKPDSAKPEIFHPTSWFPRERGGFQLTANHNISSGFHLIADVQTAPNTSALPLNTKRFIVPNRLKPYKNMLNLNEEQSKLLESQLSAGAAKEKGKKQVVSKIELTEEQLKQLEELEMAAKKERQSKAPASEPKTPQNSSKRTQKISPQKALKKEIQESQVYKDLLKELKIETISGQIRDNQPYLKETKNAEEKFKKDLKKQGITGENIQLRLSEKLTTFMDEIIRRKIHTLKENIVEILVSIYQSIEKEGEFYPHYTTEQIILAFFCEKFNTQEDIRVLLKGLESDITQNIGALSSSDDLLNEMDLKELEKKIENSSHEKEGGRQPALDLDDLYLLANSDVFTRQTPYKLGNGGVISNGLAKPYNRTTNKLIDTNLYADCVETAMRHIINLLIYDGIKKQFNLEAIKQYVQNNSSPYFLNFEKFYQEQLPQQANNGDTLMRSLWNRVVGDLNESNLTFPSVFYAHDFQDSTQSYQYESDTGFINLVRTFQKIFGFQLKDNPELANLDVYRANLSQKKEWVEAYLKEIFSILNPTRDYSIDVSGLSEETKSTLNIQRQDLYGDLKVNVTSKTSNKSLFSFVIYSGFGHSQINDLKQPASAPILLAQPYIEKLQENTSERSFWGLLPQEDKENKNSIELFYNLFSQSLEDNKTRIQALNLLNNSRFAQMPFAMRQSLVIHILENTSWNDEYTVDEITSVIEKLEGSYKDLREVLQSHVKGFKMRAENKGEIDRVLKRYSNLEYFYLNFEPDDSDDSDDEDSKNDEPQDLDLTKENLLKLKVIKFSGQHLKTLKFPYLPELEDLDLMGSFAEITLDEKISPKLKRFNTGFLSSIDRLTLTSLPDLEVADLSLANSFQEIALINAPKLKKIDFGQSASNLSIKKMTLSYLPELESLNVAMIKDIEELTLTDLAKLKDLHFSHFSQDRRLHVSQIKKMTIASLGALEMINLNFVSYLRELTLVDLPNLKKIDLSSSNLKLINNIQLDKPLVEGDKLREILQNAPAKSSQEAG